MLQRLVDFFTLFPEDFQMKKQRYLAAPIYDIQIVDIPRNKGLTTRPSPVFEYMSHWGNKPHFQALPVPLPESAASSPFYDNGGSDLAEPPSATQRAEGYRDRWYETSTRNVYIDWVTPGRWVIYTGTVFYVLR
jgi:hypothetical protein